LIARDDVFMLQVTVPQRVWDEPTMDGLTGADDEETALWHRTLAALHAKGATHTEAVDGATLILLAYRRKREEMAQETDVERTSVSDVASHLRESGMRRKPGT
jgi:hypothetical protein